MSHSLTATLIDWLTFCIWANVIWFDRLLVYVWRIIMQNSARQCVISWTQRKLYFFDKQNQKMFCLARWRWRLYSADLIVSDSRRGIQLEDGWSTAALRYHHIATQNLVIQTLRWHGGASTRARRNQVETRRSLKILEDACVCLLRAGGDLIWA